MKKKIIHCLFNGTFINLALWKLPCNIINIYPCVYFGNKAISFFSFFATTFNILCLMWFIITRKYRKAT